MVKFVVKNTEIDENSGENVIKFNNANSISIYIKIKKSYKKDIKIVKYLFDDETLTRASIVKLALLGYKIKEITKLLKINRRLALKW